MLPLYIIINNFATYLDKQLRSFTFKFIVQLSWFENNTCANDQEYSGRRNKYNFEECIPATLLILTKIKVMACELILSIIQRHLETKLFMILNLLWARYNKRLGVEIQLISILICIQEFEYAEHLNFEWGLRISIWVFEYAPQAEPSSEFVTPVPEKW